MIKAKHFSAGLLILLGLTSIGFSGDEDLTTIGTCGAFLYTVENIKQSDEQELFLKILDYPNQFNLFYQNKDFLPKEDLFSLIENYLKSKDYNIDDIVFKNPNDQEDGLTLLHAAAFTVNNDLLKWLIDEKKADIQKQTECSKTLFHLVLYGSWFMNSCSVLKGYREPEMIESSINLLIERMPGNCLTKESKNHLVSNLNEVKLSNVRNILDGIFHSEKPRSPRDITDEPDHLPESISFVSDFLGIKEHGIYDSSSFSVCKISF